MRNTKTQLSPTPILNKSAQTQFNRGEVALLEYMCAAQVAVAVAMCVLKKTDSHIGRKITSKFHPCNVLNRHTSTNPFGTINTGNNIPDILNGCFDFVEDIDSSFGCSLLECKLWYVT